MFSQLFGKYLVDNKVITKEQLDEVIGQSLDLLLYQKVFLLRKRLRRLIFSRHKRMLSSVI